MKNIIIYTSPTCHFCHQAKDFFKANNIPFTEKDAASDATARTEAMDKSGQLGVPVIDIEGKILVGFSEPEVRAALGM